LKHIDGFMKIQWILDPTFKQDMYFVISNTS